jgi:integrase
MHLKQRPKEGRPLGSKSLAHLFERELANLLLRPNDDGSLRIPDEISVAVERRRRSSTADRITSHQLRRFYATLLKRRGVDLETIRRRLGHRHLNTTQRYLDGGPDEDSDEIFEDRLPEEF